MRFRKSRTEDSTFDLNLAPMLDIIVAIVPMLLLSVVFVEISTVDTQVPQAVEKAMVEAQKKNEVQISLYASLATGFKIVVQKDGKENETSIALKNSALDLETLHRQVVGLKQQFPETFRLEIHPDESLQLEQVVGVMDRVRNRSKDDPKLYFTDVESGKQLETDLIFPDVVFGNVAGG